MRIKTLILTVFIAFVIIFSITNVFNFSVRGEGNTNNRLHFNSNDKYKIVQFNDIQDSEDIDSRTTELMNTVLDEQEPDLAILNGDMLNEDFDTAVEVKRAINNFVKPMEDRGVHWAITFGNHDEDHTSKTGMDEEDMLDVYMSYEHNVNKTGPENITGTGNANLLIYDSQNQEPAFNTWLFDSGTYAPDEIANQDFEGYPTWDWLRHDQVQWYYDTSKELEQTTGHKVPSLAFMHIPLPEFEYMWYGSLSERTEKSHESAIKKHDIKGEKNESVSTGPFNSGMFAAMLERGDVKGVFSGHDHINTFVGDYYGIQLGYAGSVGFGAYGLEGEDKDRLRGARVFNLEKREENVLVDTKMLFAKDYGIQ